MSEMITADELVKRVRTMWSERGQSTAFASELNEILAAFARPIDMINEADQKSHLLSLVEAFARQWSVIDDWLYGITYAYLRIMRTERANWVRKQLTEMAGVDLTVKETTVPPARSSERYRIPVPRLR